MESCLLDLAKNEVQSLVNLVKNEAQYLCCFNSYVENFEQKKKILAAKHKDVKRKFQKGKGVYSFKCEAMEWEHDADDIIDVDTKIKKKLFFEWCPNCWWQYRRGKELAEKTRHIESLLERCNSNIVAGRANVLDIKYLSSQGFIHFQSRESTFQALLEALEDENCNMIGLQGLGGTGKTSMAKEVGHKLKKSKFVDKFIFLVVSQPPDFRKIRGELAKGLDLNLDEVKEEELLSTILSRITNIEEKLLIILDDVWVKFDMTENLGIPIGHQHKGCNLLITTRSSHVCIEMGCHMIQLQALTNEEASNLFEAHTSLNSSSRGFKGMPQKIVKHCGGVPIAIVAIARALKNKPISVWKDALKTLEDRGLDQHLEEAYKCLKLSYDNLKNQKAKELLLISSLLPEDFEIPIKLLIKIGMGLGSFNENEKYHLIRSEVHGAIMELIYSSLLLNDKKECVKLHDLVREVALWIGENNIQSLLDLEKPIKGNLIYLVWKNDKFPAEFDGKKLEVLLILLDDFESLIVTDTFFKKMTSLKILVLINDDKRGPALSLKNSLQPLKFIQTLILVGLELGDISALGSLSSLITLWFQTCSIIELPKEFLKLKKLRSLEVGGCEIEKNNPFEVIEMCSQLEELTFVSNECDNDEKDAISQNGSPLRLHRYHISSEGDLSYYFKEYGFVSRYFRVDELGHLVSDSTFKQLVGRAEVLLLEGEDKQRIWKNLVPDIVPIEKEGVMNDLIVLDLSSRLDMECLIGTKNHDPDVTAFCNLAELHLFKMGVEDLCRGPLPSGFLEQLEILKLTKCYKLKGILFNGNYNLCHLKSMQLEGCSELMSVFQPYTARSLKQLKELTIRNCNVLEYIIVGEDGDSNQKSYYDSLFPSLKELELSRVPSFIGIFREYHQLMSSSMHNPSPPLSRHNSSNLNQSLAIRAFSWVQVCCSLNKLRSASKERNITISEYISLDHTNPSGLLASKKWIDTAPTLMRQLVLHFCHIREMEFAYFSLNLISRLFTLSVASMILWEELIITNCHGLKHLVTSDEDDYIEQINCYSIFPKLQNLEIRECEDLEFLFLSTISIEIKNIKSLTIKDAPKLTYVVGKHHNETQNDELHFDLPSLEALCFENVPEFIGIGLMNFIRVSPSLQDVCLDEGHLNSKTIERFDASTDRSAPSLAAPSLLIQSLKNVREIELMECENIISLSTLSIAASTIALATLTIRRCHKLKCITTHERDAQVDKNNCSIFPKLEKLRIEDCEELEILFASSISVGLEKLKSLTIEEVPKLKYVVGNYQKELCLSNQNQNDELCFNLPALETLDINNAPMVNGICSQKYKLKLSSHLNIVIKNCSNKSFIEKFDASIDRGAPSLAIQSILVQLVKNVREIELVECGNIISLSTLSIAASTVALETLTICGCHGLKCITTYEGDAQVDNNSYSIFPKLEKLRILDCKELEILFASSISVGLEKLMSLTIQSVPKLKYVVGNYQKELRPSNQNQNDELCFNLPALETLNIEYAQMMNGICSEKYKLELSSLMNVVIKNCSIKSFTEKFDASTDRGAPPLIAQNILVQSVKNVREIKLVECENIISLSTLSIATSAAALETLTISECHKLKYITTHKGDAHVDKNYCSIFPRLQKLRIMDCDELEILFVSSISVGLEKLMSLTILRVPKLKYVVGNGQKEQHSSNQNQNDELCFNLPALETLNIENAPMMNSIFAKNYSLLNWTATEEVPASTNGAPLFHVAQILLIQPLKNIREIELVDCGNLISLTTLSIASTILLDVLTIRACGQLKCLVSDEGDAKTQINCNSIFPKLKWLEVSHCNALEYLFPAYAFRSPLYLESLKINYAFMLKYVFGRSQHDDSLSHDGSQNVQTLIDFPALKDLSIGYVPKLISIYPKNYYMRGLYLRSVNFKKLLKFTMRPFNEFLVCWHTKQQETKVIEICWKTLGYLEVRDFKIEEIFDLAYMETEKKGGELQSLTSSLRYLELQNLNDLMNTCVGPKCIIRFDSLQYLTIEACRNLRVIFSASIVRSFRGLENLRISGCEELVHIVKEDYETNADDHLPYEPYFPNLKYISLSNCDKLKYLFSITISDIFPKLRGLEISEANELEHVLIKRDEMEEMFKENLLPKRCHLELVNLPNLISVYHGINFQKEDYSMKVYNCPKLETSTTQYQVDPKTGSSQVEEKSEGSLSSQQSLTKEIQGATEEIVEEDFMSKIAETKISSSDSKLTGLLVVEERAEGVSSKLFEEEEEEHGSLITSRCLRSGIKASSTLSKEKLETSIDGDKFAPPATTVLSEQTSQVILPLSPISSEASTSLSHTPSSILSKASDDEDVQVYDKSHPHSANLIEGVHHGDIKEAGMVQNEYKSNVKPSSLTQREQESSYSKGQIQTKDQLIDLQPRSTIPTTPFVTMSQDEYSEEPFPLSLNSTSISRSPSTTMKIFEEEEKGGLITTSKHESDMKAVSSLPPEKEHETFNQGRNIQENVGATNNQSLHVTLGAVQISRDPFVPLGPMSSKVSTSLNQTPLSILLKPSDGDPFVPLHPISSKISSTLPTKPSDETTTTSDGSKNQDSEVCEGTEQKLSSHLNGRQAVEAQPPTTSSSDFIRGTKEDAREIVEEGIIFQKPKMINLSSGFIGGSVTSRGHRSDIKAQISLLKEKPEIPIHGDPNVQCTIPILSEQTEAILPPSTILSKASTGLDQTPQAILCKHTNDDDIQVSDKSNAAAIGGVVPIPKPFTQEIVEMMKLAGSETCLLEEALKTHPQLCLSKNDRSTEMMCVSYRVLINILNILTTRTPFTITEADKRLLEEKLKDAYLLGFDKHWLDSIKTRVFNCDVSDVNGMQETLEGLESDLKTNEMMLVATRNQELEAARKVEFAQKDLDAALQEHANVMANHTQLLKARQDILARQNRCWDMIATKNKHFGF